MHLIEVAPQPQPLNPNPNPQPMTLENKTIALQQQLAGYGQVAVCFSGGVDSTLLLQVTINQLGPANVLALLADTPSMPRREVESACRIAESMGCHLRVVQTYELDDPVYISNPKERCYYCKQIIFGSLIAAAGEMGYNLVVDGNNFDDADDDRPGHQAAVEMGIRSPLMDACLTKDEIRKLSRALNLPTADKPALACLATRVPTGVPISRELLQKIERAEQILWDAGFSQVRLRDNGRMARIEIDEKDFEKIALTQIREQIRAGIRASGYEQVVLDLQPLQRR